ncbi:ABC transporter permease [Williamwhitmania taraxaci]|uniref:Molybdate/tungstate transport system permease protein n=1 Tax=Williamwhitmania taraxaci TaxID=1640674 RepID=A0A1G6N9F7_9BACT|nr:ABC transporter permease [Williamwhitmania taraxaci]SDC63876.1 molybdate/tungstate transport system permease protein [Williamwhitmania taraxaci]
MKFSWFWLFIRVLGSLVLLFVIAPLVGMALHTSFPSLMAAGQDAEVTSSIWLTIWVSMMATLFFALLGVPLAFVLARKEFPLKSLVQGIVDLPVVIPHSAAGIALLGFISRDSSLGRVASLAGLDLVGHPIGIAIAMAFVSIPFLVNAARDGFAMVPERYEKAALTLGASPVRVFFTISIPLAWRSVVSGMVMMFARGMSEFGAVIIVAYHPMVAPVLVYERFSTFGLAYSRPAALLFILVSLAVFVLIRLLLRKKQ